MTRRLQLESMSTFLVEDTPEKGERLALAEHELDDDFLKYEVQRELHLYIEKHTPQWENEKLEPPKIIREVEEIVRQNAQGWPRDYIIT